MKIVYVLGNYLPHSRQIADHLGLEGEIVTLADYGYQEGTVPIMISTHGIFHADSAELSRKVNGSLKFKAMADGHSDFSNVGEREGMVETMLGEADIPPSQDLVSRGSRCGCHLRESYSQGDVESFGVFGLRSDEQANSLFRTFWNRGECVPREIIAEQGLAIPEGHRLLNGGYDALHLTVDTDTIKDAEYIRPHWRNESGIAPTLGEVLEFAGTVANRNRVVAFDVAGFSPSSPDLSSDVDQAGLRDYGEIIGTVREALV